MKPLRIAIADDEPRMRDYLWRYLERLGHQVVFAARTGRELVEQCRRWHPELVITDVKMPDLDGIDAAKQIYQDEAVPVILVSAFHDRELLERAARNHVMAYLVKPIKEGDLEPAITVAMERFRQFTMLRQEAANMRQALEDRKLIERAKGILMKHTTIDEPTAFRRMQKLASRKNLKLVEIAQMILTAGEATSEEEA